MNPLSRCCHLHGSLGYITFGLMLVTLVAIPLQAHRQRMMNHDGQNRLMKQTKMKCSKIESSVCLPQ